MLTGTVSLLVEKGHLSQEDIEQRAGGSFELAGPVADRPMADLTPRPKVRFNVGDRVMVLTISPGGHICAPKFCRGYEGTVIHRAPKIPFPETSAHGGERRKEHTYHVEFASKDLWYDSDVANDSVIVDLWDSYLEAAS